MRACPLLFLFFCGPLFAAPPTQSTAELSDSFKGFSGNASVNQAAGESLQQVNVRYITLGTQSATSVSVHQVNDATVPPGGLDADAHIRGAAFSQSNGISGVNQSAGVGNQSINSFQMAVSVIPNSLDDTALSQSTAVTAAALDGAAVGGGRTVEISDQAFAGSHGVVQLNQSAGVGNRTINSLSIRVVDRP